MATKRDRTAFAVSNNLKTAMNAAGYIIPIQPGQAFYDGAANDRHLAHEQFDDGSFRTTNVIGTAIEFDFISEGDPNLARFWTERELQVFIGSIPGAGGSSGTLNVDTWTWVIPFNGQNFSANDTSKPDAIAKALIKVLQQPAARKAG